MPEPTKVIGNKQTDNCLSNNFLWLQCIILPKFLQNAVLTRKNPWKIPLDINLQVMVTTFHTTLWSKSSKAWTLNLTRLYSTKELCSCCLFSCLGWLRNTFTNLCLFKTRDWCMQVKCLINSEKTLHCICTLANYVHSRVKYPTIFDGLCLY